MKKLFLVLGLVTVLLASCCNNNQQGAKCNKADQNCEMKQACTKQCDSIKPCEQKCETPCEKPCAQKCETPCEKAQNCEVKAECPHNHEGCQHQHGAEK